MTEQITISKKVTSQAEKITALLAEGKTLEEALAVTSLKTKRESVDRIEYISNLASLEELRLARKTAYAKKSKSKDKPEALARYQAEIDLASSRINELIAEINESQVPWMRAIELGETADGSVQYFLTDTELEVNEYFEKAVGTKAQIKALTRQTPPNTDFVPDELKDAFIRRLGNQDQRVQVLASRYNLMEGLKAGKVKMEAPKNAEK